MTSYEFIKIEIAENSIKKRIEKYPYKKSQRIVQEGWE